MAALVSVRDWASLPSPLLCSVAERLIPVACARVRAVCRHWASAVSPEEWEEGRQQPRSYYLPRSPNCPWLMVSSSQDQSTGFVNFLSLPESLSPYRIFAPELLNKRVIGSHAGWLATVDPNCDMCLINPLTRSQIPLPSITTFPAVSIVRDPTAEVIFRKPLVPGPDIECYSPEFICNLYFIKMFLSSSPSSSDDYVVVLLFGGMRRLLLFARAGDTEWCPLWNTLSSIREHPPIVDAVFVDQNLYTVHLYGEIRVIDFSEPNPQTTEIAESTRDYGTVELFYLVYSPESNHLLQLFRVLDEEEEDDDDDPRYITLKFVVEKLDLQGKGKKSRIPVEDLGCRSIFVGMNQTCLVSTDGITGLKPNCIYFTADDLEWMCYRKDDTRDVGVYNLKEDTCEPLYPQDAWLNWPPPIWFSPM